MAASGLRLLIVNSNTSDEVTALVDGQARRVASQATVVRTVTAPFGPRSIESRAEAAIAAHATLDAFAREASWAQAGVVACFSDPGLLAARELFPFPVAGIAEAAMLTACQLGGRFSVVTVGSRMVPVIEELASLYGLAGRLASVRTAESSVLSVAADQEGRLAAFRRLAVEAVRLDRAEVVILGGAVMAGIADRISPDVPVPVVDGVTCAVLVAEKLARLGARRPEAGSFAAPGQKDMPGVSERLSELFSASNPAASG